MGPRPVWAFKPRPRAGRLSMPGAGMMPKLLCVVIIFFGIVLEGLYFVSVLVAWLAAPRKPKEEVLDAEE